MKRSHPIQGSWRTPADPVGRSPRLLVALGLLLASVAPAHGEEGGAPGSGDRPAHGDRPALRTPEPAVCPGLLRASNGLRLRPEGVVERAVCDALVAASDRLPDAPATALWIARAERYETAGDSVFDRYLADAVMASFSRWPRRTITVYDGGATLSPRWTGGDLDLTRTLALLAPLSDILGVPPPDASDMRTVQRAWSAFIERLNRVLGAGVDPELPLGAEEALDALVRLGPEVRLGDTSGLEAILLHELGHARMEAFPGWGALSGFEDRFEASPMRPDAWGIAVARLALGGGAGGFSASVPGLDAAFVSPYARLSAGEDLAESHAAFFESPGKLFAVAPEKYLVLNVRANGRLIRPASELDRAGLERGLAKIRERLPGPTGRRILAAYGGGRGRRR